MIWMLQLLLMATMNDDDAGDSLVDHVQELEKTEEGLVDDDRPQPEEIRPKEMHEEELCHIGEEELQPEDDITVGDVKDLVTNGHVDAEDRYSVDESERVTRSEETHEEPCPVDEEDKRRQEIKHRAMILLKQWHIEDVAVKEGVGSPVEEGCPVVADDNTKGCSVVDMQSESQ